METMNLARTSLKTFDESDWHTWSGAVEFADGSDPRIGTITVDGVEATLIHSGLGLHIHDDAGAWMDYIGTTDDVERMLERLGTAVDGGELFALGWIGLNGAEFDGQQDADYNDKCARIEKMLDAARDFREALAAARDFREALAPSIHINGARIEDDREGALGALKVVFNLRTQSDAAPWPERKVEISKRDGSPLWRVMFEGSVVGGPFYVNDTACGGHIAIAFV